jgi:hypothetical protein
MSATRRLRKLEAVPRLVVDDRDVGLVRGRATARIHDHPRAGELDHARVGSSKSFRSISRAPRRGALALSQ